LMLRLVGLGITGLAVTFMAMIINLMIYSPLPWGLHFVVGPSLIALLIVAIYAVWVMVSEA
jgi:hypothetical protein